LNDPWWADKISDDEDLFDIDVDVGHGDSGVGPSIRNENPSNVEAEICSDEYDGEEGHEEGNDDGGNHTMGDDYEDAEDHTEGDHDGM
jgi:hypothetical protein